GAAGFAGRAVAAADSRLGIRRSSTLRSCSRAGRDARRICCPRAQVRESLEKTALAGFLSLIWAVNLGSTILRKIPEPELKKHLPVNDARFLFIEDKIVVQFRSLLRVGEGDVAGVVKGRKGKGASHRSMPPTWPASPAGKRHFGLF